MTSSSSDDLRKEIGFLGAVLGDTISELEGQAALDTVEELRRAAWDRRSGREGADKRIKQLISSLSDQELRVVIRAFTTFLDLFNVVEDRRRVQVLEQRSADAFPEPRSESVGSAINELQLRGKSAQDVQALVDEIQVDLVFTAHPTEAKRRSVRNKLRTIRGLMNEYHRQQQPHRRDQTERKIRAEVAKLWQTDFIRPWRPSVMQEVARGLSIKSVLWETVPEIHRELNDALKRQYGDAVQTRHPGIVFGSWIGGDRDGHPGVTPKVTRQTLQWLRREAIAFHLRTAQALFDSLSLSERQVHLGEALTESITQAIGKWPELEERLSGLPPGEICRRWLSIIRWRLEQTSDDLDENASDQKPVTQSAVYRSACELAGDLNALIDATSELPVYRHIAPSLQSWKTQIETFGLHLARLDVRQNASVYFSAINEILRKTGLCDDPDSLSEEDLCELLSQTLPQRQSLSDEGFSDSTAETLSLFRTLHEAAEQYSMAAIGAHVISMTSAPSDAMTVLWFWEQTRPTGEATSDATLPIVPLLETVEDLQNGPAILSGMLSNDAYRQHLRRLGDRQMIMLGYSDSTKDGGYLSACWSLHEAQKNLVAVCEEFGVKVTFFHGRGGSLGRGGGPAARSILSLPRGTFDGHLRITEQGEVLADRYDDPAIAHRHLEQMIWSSLLAAGEPVRPDSEPWHVMMDQMAQASFEKYRELIEHPGFVSYFRRATPISEIEQLPIGSRPSRRKPDGGLADLRAIPWVFSWTQARCLVPAWYGLGAAMSDSVRDNAERAQLLTMYNEWPFFRAMIDNAELALAKSDLKIAMEYARLANKSDAADEIASMISLEYRSACNVVLALTGQDELLGGTSWLKESIRIRNRFIDPLNLIQVELLRRTADPPPETDLEELRHITRLSINGIAAGMRTSG
ncbi:phosphoenolpyruvate carboxylase [Stieleria varia]|uniref:Phosphoenolpyruvate carboxylase n=1 Tax=Stieleria varia TaxID=2528005 RepID=A0A5C6B769_9BACT|nr:phosphoenolpyruvate carboxylase [Stieleria varia]TWU07883.1 Phosphoenolpyruvate carboxylase [Stieleria varia]